MNFCRKLGGGAYCRQQRQLLEYIKKKKKITVLSFLPFHHVFYVLDNWHAWHIVQIQAMFWHYFQGCFFAVGTCFIKQYISCKIFKAVVFWSAQQKKKKKSCDKWEKLACETALNLSPLAYFVPVCWCCSCADFDVIPWIHLPWASILLL